MCTFLASVSVYIQISWVVNVDYIFYNVRDVPRFVLKSVNIYVIFVSQKCLCAREV